MRSLLVPGNAAVTAIVALTKPRLAGRDSVHEADELERQGT